MSLNKLTSIQKGLDINLKIGCEDFKVNGNTLLNDVEVVGNLGVVDIIVDNEFKVNGDCIVGGVNLNAGSLGSNGQVMRTNGSGDTVWSDITLPVVKDGVNLAFFTILSGSGTISNVHTIYYTFGPNKTILSGNLVVINYAGVPSAGNEQGKIEISVNIAPFVISYPSILTLPLCGTCTGVCESPTMTRGVSCKVSKLSASAFKITAYTDNIDTTVGDPQRQLTLGFNISIF